MKKLIVYFINYSIGDVFDLQMSEKNELQILLKKDLVFNPLDVLKLDLDFLLDLLAIWGTFPAL
jgi:hypothetical protein